jgi:hypothetical protein
VSKNVEETTAPLSRSGDPSPDSARECRISVALELKMSLRVRHARASAGLMLTVRPSAGLDQTARPEVLSPEKFAELFSLIWAS